MGKIAEDAVLQQRTGDAVPSMTSRPWGGCVHGASTFDTTSDVGISAWIATVGSELYAEMRRIGGGRLPLNPHP